VCLARLERALNALSTRSLCQLGYRHETAHPVFARRATTGTRLLAGHLPAEASAKAGGGREWLRSTCLRVKSPLPLHSGFKASRPVEELLDSLHELVQFTSRKRKIREQGIETPADDPAGWQAAVQATTHLRSEEAAKYARSATVRRPALDFDAVFGFTNAMAEDRAFVERGNKGVINFVGYERALPHLPGMVLLDATADIDGITEICGHRVHAKTPVERYDRLEVIHTPSVATGN
jgi:hypothetical protein